LWGSAFSGSASRRRRSSSLCWPSFEALLDGLALELADIPSEVGLCFTAQVAGSARKLDAYIAVAKVRGAKKASALLEGDFAKRTAALAEQRNRAVHDPWLIQEGNIPQRFEITARRKLRSEMVPVTTDDLITLAKHIEEHTRRFFEIDEQIRTQIGASHETLP
jgi:hypothetical protein